MTQTLKHSPIPAAPEVSDMAGWQVSAAYDTPAQELQAARTAVALCDHTAHGRFRVEGTAAAAALDAADLALQAGRPAHGEHLYRLRPDLFFLTTPAEAATAAQADLVKKAAGADGLVTVTDVSHGNAELWLIGPRSRDVLRRLCGLDVHDRAFPNHTARQSSVAKTAQLILRRDQAGVPAFGLIGPRSLAAYLWRTILEAGRDLDLQPIGITAWQQLTGEGDD